MHGGHAPIDCDVHISLPGVRALLPHLDEYWQDAVISRGMNQLELSTYPPNAPLSARPEWREDGRGGTSLDLLRREALDRFGSRLAVAHCLSGAQAVFDEHFGRAFCRALNTWIAREWLDPEPRLRASIVVPTQNPIAAAEEIELRAPDRRFVQVLMLAMGDMPYGRSYYWPIYEAAQRHKLPIGIHAGGMRRHAPTSIGWPSHHLEDYASNAQAFEAQLLSLVCEGVFTKFPDLKVVLIESGFSWVPSFLWRFNKTWRGLRTEVPWVKRPPAEIIREHVRMTLQPVDVPPDPVVLDRVLEQLGSDRMLLFSTDFPHWQFDGERVVPDGISAGLLARILVDNPLETYPGIERTAQIAVEAIP